MEHASSLAGTQFFVTLLTVVGAAIFHPNQVHLSRSNRTRTLAALPARSLEFELDHLRLLHSGEAVTTWALHRFDLTGSDLLDIYARPAAARIPALLDRLDKGARFCPAEA